MKIRGVVGKLGSALLWNPDFQEHEARALSSLKMYKIAEFHTFPSFLGVRTYSTGSFPLHCVSVLHRYGSTFIEKHGDHSLHAGPIVTSWNKAWKNHGKAGRTLAPTSPTGAGGDLRRGSVSDIAGSSKLCTTRTMALVKPFSTPEVIPRFGRHGAEAFIQAAGFFMHNLF